MMVSIFLLRMMLIMLVSSRSLSIHLAVGDIEDGNVIVIGRILILIRSRIRAGLFRVITTLVMVGMMKRAITG